jgi:hypothetical protein
MYNFLRAGQYNIKKSNKEMMRLPGKAKQYVDQSMTSVQSAVSSLQQALGNAEKAENKAVIQQAKKDNLCYLTATHDIKNIHSGNVMKKVGMHYCYSYKEQWMPKNRPVIFRIYQINLDGKKRIYQKYWNQYEHFIEENI